MLNCYPLKSKYKLTDNTIEGYIHNLEIDGSKLSIMLIGKEKIIVTYYFKTEKEKKNFSLELGDYIKSFGVMNKPKKATVFNLFNYKDYLYHNHINYLFTADKMKLIKSNTRWQYKIKQLIIDHINDINTSSSYIKALVVGDDNDFNDEINKSYQLNGVSHLFAISGSHITFLSVFILWFLKKIKIEENKRYYIVILFLFFYMFLTDYTGSVVRSIIFFVLLAFNKMYYFNIKIINILKLTLFVSLMYKSELLYDVGFQFSFIISYFLIKYQSIINKCQNYFKQVLLISIISFLVSIPICINNFFQINLLSPIINVFFVPYVSFILFPLSFLSLILPFLDDILFFFINILESLSVFLSNIKIGVIILSKPWLIIIILYYFFITIAVNGLAAKKNYFFIPLIMLIIIHSNINYFNDKPYLVFIDVGQGDSILINLPHNKGSILIDTGGKLNFEESWQKKKKQYSIGEDTIIPYLKSIGIKRLDYLFLTHGDEDHMGEAINIVKHFKIKKVILNNGSLVTLEKALIKELNKLNITYSFGKRGDIITISDYQFYLLNPSININENDNSLVIYTIINNRRILLTGDISIKIESNIINAYKNLKVDILKVGHHGSKTSTSTLFLDAIEPKYGIIQVGLNNRFRHPSNSVINSLTKKGVKILQTSTSGSIKIIIGTNEVTIKTSLT
jgi:competence protein ComEC